MSVSWFLFRPVLLKTLPISALETMKRISKVHQHLVNSESNGPETQFEVLLALSNGMDIGQLISKLPNELPKADEYDISKHLYGPLQDKETYPNGWEDAFRELRDAQTFGITHVKFAEWQLKYGKSLSANIAVPYMIFKRSGGDEGPPAPPVIRLEVIIADPEDSRRIARLHVQKQPNFNLMFYNSIISTTDNDYWTKQREEMVSAFLPQASLSHIFKISADRAKFCSSRLKQLAKTQDSVVDMSDFMLHETQAQLQLALFGESEEFMNATNAKFRKAMSGDAPAGFVRPFCRELANHMQNGNHTQPAAPADVSAGRCPMTHGPLSAAFRDFDDKRGKNSEGNALIFAFAGHDTTGNTLSFLILELARNKHIQTRLQAEVDAFWAKLGDREPEFKDLQLLPFMTRCIMETLRLWPAVANGTFREIQFDDYIKGPNGKDVLIKKGTYVRIVNWSRHRNPELWGSDADIFNPDREFRDEEIWHGEPFRAYNPATERFSPFTFPPRACIGMGFAQTESRVILANLLRDFSFEMTPEFESKLDPKSFFGVNYGTLGVVDVTQPPLVKGYSGFAPAIKVPSGLPMRVIPRNNK